MLMGIIKWDREVSLEQAKSGEKLPDIIGGMMSRIRIFIMKRSDTCFRQSVML